MRNILLAVTALFLLGGAATAAEPVVRIGVDLSLTGEFSPAGRKALAGIRMRVDEHNARAGEAGFPGGTRCPGR